MGRKVHIFTEIFFVLCFKLSTEETTLAKRAQYSLTTKHKRRTSTATSTLGLTS